MPKQNNDLEPLTKRQKCSNGDEEVSRALSLGGPMYDEATARKVLEEAVRIPAKYANDGEAVIGFDPNDAALDNLYIIEGDDFPKLKVTPMAYFTLKRDVKMCRYLISRGASTTKFLAAKHLDLHDPNSPGSFFPMLIAARDGPLDICKLLYANGAQNDVRKESDGDGWTPFHVAAHSGRDEILRWLTLHGALCAGGSERVVGDRIFPSDVEWFRMRQVKRKLSPSCNRLVEWAKDVTQTHSAMVTFLGGSLPPALDERQTRILQCLSVHPGIRKHIGDFVGLEVTKVKHLRILRQVVDALPSFIRTD